MSSFKMSGASTSSSSGGGGKKGGYYEYMFKHVHCCTAPSQVNVTIKDYYNVPKVFINGYKGKSISLSAKDMSDILKHGSNILKSIDECQKLCDEKEQEQSKIRKKHRESIFMLKEVEEGVQVEVEELQMPPPKKIKSSAVSGAGSAPNHSKN